MYQVKANPSIQRLNLTIDSNIAEKEAEKILALLRQETAKLKPGYVAAIDFRGVTVLAPVLKEAIQQAQLILVSSQPSKVGTLLESSVLKMQISMSAQKTGLNDKVQRFDNEVAWKRFIETA
jgi:ABC-type transporter Mla MlaB component